MELNLNPDNIMLVKLVNGLELIGRDETPEGSSEHVIKEALFIELTVDQERSTPEHISYKPTFEPVSRLVDPGSSVNGEVDLVLQPTSVLFKKAIHPHVIPHYKQLTSKIILQ
ncbi:hypothetical protein [Stenotrophomonas phage RAS14]